jgi:hypothetical protein
MTDKLLILRAFSTLNQVRDAKVPELNLLPGFHELIEDLRARLAQPEPEPVIKMKELLEVQGRDGNWNLDQYMQGMYNGMELMVALAEGRDPVFRKAPENWLSTPPQREWQGLTDEERTFLAWESNNGAHCVAITEAKLKEKNT